MLWRRVGDEVLVAAGDEEPSLLTGPARAVWDLLDTARTVSQIARELSAEYEAAPAAIVSDMKPFLAALVARGVVDEVHQARD